jgi:hypothetical protein
MDMPRALLPAALLALTLAACNETPAPVVGSVPPAPPAPPPATASAAPAPHSAPENTGGVVIGKNDQGEPMMKIDPADATCSADADCGITRTQCECDCGSAVNVAHKQKYRAALEPMCKDYRGRMCKMAPCTLTAICDKGVCRSKE